MLIRVWLVAVLASLAAGPATPQDLVKRDPAVQRNLGRLHAILHQPPGRSDANRHDAYLSLIDIGNEETIPLLLNRLRQDYGGSEPTPTDAAKFGFVCTRVHLVDALRSITNTDQGMFYPRWAEWWASNSGYTRLKWVLDGFAAAGMHTIEPPDERFGLELIEALAGQRAYYAINAHRLLIRVPTRVRSGWVMSAARSDNSLLRLGALKDLERIDTSAHDDVIRKLTSDTHEAVRDLAASIAKGRQGVKR